MKQLGTWIGAISILICLVTWGIEMSGFVQPCIYCRIERTIIGMNGLLMLLPTIPYLSRYLIILFGFFGATTAAQQIIDLLSMNSFFVIELPLAIAALFIIIGQVFLVFSNRVL